MALGIEKSPEVFISASGLTFDADCATMIAVFTDELGAYRARKNWQKVFHDYFLLESDRDYDCDITLPEENSRFYILSCSFSSACGRYAFWRLINHQSPEAEKKLSGSINGERHIIKRTAVNKNLSREDEQLPWVLNASTNTIRNMNQKEIPSLLASIRRLFS
jgi:hypothetical protein